MSRSRQSTPGIVCLGAVGAAYLASAVFPCDAGCPRSGSFVQAVQNVFGFFEYAGAIAGFLLLGPVLRRTSAFRGLAAASFLSAALVSIGFGAMLVPGLDPIRGLSQRIAELSILSWIAYCSVLLLRVRGARPADRGGTGTDRSFSDAGERGIVEPSAARDTHHGHLLSPVCHRSPQGRGVRNLREDVDPVGRQARRKAPWVFSAARGTEQHRGRAVQLSVRFELDRAVVPFELCHCTRCRKASGSAFVAGLGVRAEDFRLRAGAELIRRYEAPVVEHPPPYGVAFCSRCGSPVPDPPLGASWFEIPAGLLDDDPEVRPYRHIFVECRSP